MTTHEAKELASALEQNRSLEKVEIDKHTVTITDDGIRILKQVLSSHPTVKDFDLPDTEPDHSSSDDDDLQLAMAVSLSMVPEEEQRRRGGATASIEPVSCRPVIIVIQLQLFIRQFL